MSASRFVGRVGGLAVALGVGAAVFSSAGTVGADTVDGSARGADSAGSAGSGDSAAPRAGARRGNAGPARGAAVRGSNRQRATVSAVNAPPIASPAAGVSRRAAALAVAGPESATAGSGTTDQTAADEALAAAALAARPAFDPGPPVGPDVRVIIDPLPEPAQAYEVTAFLSEADTGVTDGADTDPLVPADSPAAWALLAAARRQTLSAAISTAPTAQVTSSATVTGNGITVDPTVGIADGIIQGYLQAVSSRGLMMTYTALGPSCGTGCAIGDLGGKISLGTIPLLGNTAQSFTVLPYANWLEGGTKGTQTFDVRIREVTAFDMFLTGIPLVGLFAAPIIDLLQTLPLIGDLLAPLIGASVVATVAVDVADLAPGDTPVAFTYDVVSFDGVKISTNFFPAAGIAAGETAPTVLNGPGLGSPGETDPYDPAGTFGIVPGVNLMRDEGYNVVTWDPRGEFASGGVLQLDNPFFEGRDASAIVSWVAENPLADLDVAGDPKVGMVGGSYGGGIQMVTASTDPRIDAIVPAGNWYSLIDALYPSEAFKTAWSALLLLDLVQAGARINTQIYEGVLTGALFGFLTQTAQAVLASSGPTSLLNQLKAPTLLLQGTVDALFPLNQSVFNAETIFANPWDTEVKLAWFCGGHGFCSTGANPLQADLLFADTFAWLNQYVKDEGTPADAIPVFQWWDQKAVRYTSDLLPFEPGFNQPIRYVATDTGGTLGILPILGGSGPNSAFSFPFSLIFPTPAGNAINIALTPDTGDQIVGAAQLSFTYSGLGTSQAVYAQFVDDATGLVVGNNVTAIPVTLDGRERTVSVPLNDIAYTVGAGDSLTLQITSWSSIFANAAIGLVNISDIEVDLPLRALPTLV